MARLPIRLGVIGTGIIWKKTHRRILCAFPEKVAIVAICAQSEQSRAEAHADFPGAKLYSDYRELVHDPVIDAVLIQTPIPLNARVALAALTAGKYVFLEKPLATNLEDAKQLVCASRTGNNRLYILEQHVYPDALTKTKDILRSGEIGRVVSYERFSGFRLVPGGDPSGYGDSAWRRDADYPLGPLMDGGIHEIAVLTELFGVPETVTAEGSKIRDQHGEYDLIAMTFRHPGGIVGTFTHSGLLGGQRNYFNVRGTNGDASVTRKSITIEPNMSESVPEAREIEIHRHRLACQDVVAAPDVH